jgi:D-serine deaminase-like pyridoxal phosphate-dependent protein
MLLPQEITTPALVVDQTRLERNLRDMADSAATRGIRLRPHAKTHKTAEIGQLQLGLGAVGLTVATIGEAEKFADAGVTDLFIAYPLWPSPQRVRRLAALAERIRLRLAVESTEAAAGFAPLAQLGRPPEILVEIDSGHHRTGVAPSQAGEVALAAARAGLPLAGVFTFPGHSYRQGGREQAAADEAAALGGAAAALRAAGVRVVGADVERSGGSTPTATVRADPPLTELRPGVYVFNDAQQVELGVCGDDQIALVAAATVVSRPSPGRFVLDSGSKVLSGDVQSLSGGFGRLLSWPDARIMAVSEHHATVVLPPGAAAPELGEIVAVVPNHVCTAVNLTDELLIVRDGAVVDTWPVMARGANS